MAVRASIATGNLTTAGTWGLVDATSYLNSETGSEILTTAYSGTRSSAFTPGAITISHIGVKLSVRTGTTGTISVNLELDSDNSQVAGTEVTIDCADLPVAATADLNGGWIFFKLATPVLLLAATAYQVAAKTSSASQVSLFRDGTADNLARALITTTTGAPAAGDDMIVAGEYTGAGTSNSFTVTMDETATTDYGAASTSLVLPALAICSKGTLSWGTTAATAYQLKLSGNLIIYSGGTHNKGTTGTPIPRDSTAELIFDCGSNVDFGMTIRNLGTYTDQGLSRTSGKNIYFCKLNTDEAVNSTSLGVDTDAGWLDNDEIVVASTTRTSGQCEAGTLNGNAGASSLTVDGFAGVGGGLAFAHSGTAPTQAEIILLTRNSITRGASATQQAYLDIKATANVDCDWARFKWMGSATANKRGIDNGATTGTVSFINCTLDNFVVASSFGYNQASNAGANTTFSNNVIWNVTSTNISVAATSASTWVMDGNIVMNSGTAATLYAISDVGGTFTNNIGIGGNQPLILTETNAAIGTVSGNTFHSSNNVSQFLGANSGTISNTTIWRINTLGLQLTSALNNVHIDGLTMFGCSTTNLQIATCANITINDFTSNGDTTFSTASGITFAGGLNLCSNIRITNSDLGTASGILTAHTQDILCAAQPVTLIMENTNLASSTEVASQSLLSVGSFIGSQQHDQTAGLHKMWKPTGTITIDTTAGLFDVTPSSRLTPNSASLKLESGSKRVAVANGGTVTVSVKVRESVVGDGTDYNGARPRLMVRKNIAAGISADTVLDTATASAEGAFETLSGTTAAVTDDSVLEFFVDCDGTTGWVNIDTWTADATPDQGGEKYWKDGLAGDVLVTAGGTSTPAPDSDFIIR